MRDSPTKSSATNFSDSPDTYVAQPNALAKAFPGAAADGVNATFDAVAAQAGGDEMGPKGVDSVFFRASESKDIEAAENANDVIAGAGAQAISVGVEAAQTEMSLAAPEHLDAASAEKAHGADEEEEGARSTTTSGDVLIQGIGEKGAGEPERGGALEEEGGASPLAAAAVAVADGVGPSESLRLTESVADNAAAAATVVAAVTTPISAPRGRAADHLRPPPIVTEDTPPILHTSSSEVMDQAGSGDENNGDVDESGSMDPEQMRRCFVAKTFSPSDLGLGEMRSAGDNGNGGGGAVQEAMTKESLMKARRRRRTIHKGITGIEGRRHTVDEVLGLDDPQAVLGSVPPERLFSITGMFHPEAPVKV